MFFWYKEVEKLLEHQVQHIISSPDLADFVLIDLVVGGDHSIRKFRMMLKPLLRYAEHTGINCQNQLPKGFSGFYTENGHKTYW